jgi:hypothetical protein
MVNRTLHAADSFADLGSVTDVTANLNAGCFKKGFPVVFQMLLCGECYENVYKACKLSTVEGVEIDVAEFLAANGFINAEPLVIVTPIVGRLMVSFKVLVCY